MALETWWAHRRRLDAGGTLRLMTLSSAPPSASSITIMAGWSAVT